ncbi:MAG: DUF4177 domain-containing protein [Tissierellia bacterium]|nr:DUF4177 domain-containing protein [Bacillota bacterium]NLL23766.1 DUF4177 domain-containing protein [Tissierellia bacterium]
MRRERMKVLEVSSFFGEVGDLSYMEKCRRIINTYQKEGWRVVQIVVPPHPEPFEILLER